MIILSKTVPRRCFFLLASAVVRSVELKPAAAVSVLLYSGGEQLQVRGPIQISLPLGHATRLRAADTVPAWAFNLKTGKNTDYTEAPELHYKTLPHTRQTQNKNI